MGVTPVFQPLKSPTTWTSFAWGAQTAKETAANAAQSAAQTAKEAAASAIQTARETGISTPQSTKPAKDEPGQ